MNTKNNDNRETCKYGASCYQKNPSHHLKFKHPKRKVDETSKIDIKKRLKQNTPEDEGSSTLKLNNASALKVKYLPTQEDVKLKIKTLFLMDMPEDFYQFYDFCISFNSTHPEDTLGVIDLKLGGPFDLMLNKGDTNSVYDAVRHCRFFYDPPEFQTILISKKSKFHFGYFRDDPNELPSFIASNDPQKGCAIRPVGGNIFSTIDSIVKDIIKTCDPFKKIRVSKLHSALSAWAKKHNISLALLSDEMKARQKKVLTKTFHGAGLVVPYNKETEVGYRSLTEEDKVLRVMFKNIKEATNETDRNVLWSKLMPVISFANIATDECDFGTGLELAINMFCEGHEVFHNTILQLMTTAYGLLSRSQYIEIIKHHLSNRIQ